MRNYFSLVCDLLDFDKKLGYENIAAALELAVAEDQEVLIFHKHGFLFSAYLDLLNGKIDAETFVKTGDFDSEYALFSGKGYWAILDQWKGGVVPEGTLLVLDKDVWQFFLDKKEQLGIQEALIEKKNQLILW